MWEDNKIYELSRSSLLALIENRIPAVRIENFADSAEADSLISELLEHACRTSSIEQVTRLGISQYEQGLMVSKENYFLLARQLEKEFSQIFTNSFSPVHRLISTLEECEFDSSVMSEPEFGNYFAGNGKLRNGYSPVHVDYAKQDSDGWSIAEAGVQLAWNLYLRVPDKGGELLLWDKLWEPEDDRYQVSNSYYYDEKVVSGVQKLRASVCPLEVIIINSQNYHAVANAEDRLAFGSFISVFDGNRLRFWS